MTDNLDTGHVQAAVRPIDGLLTVRTQPLHIGSGDLDSGRVSFSLDRRAHAARKSRRPLAVAALVIVSLVGIAFVLAKPLPPKTVATTQITNDGKTKLAYVTDGSHLYYSAYLALDTSENFQISVRGGEPHLLSMAVSWFSAGHTRSGLVPGRRRSGAAGRTCFDQSCPGHCGRNHWLGFRLDCWCRYCTPWRTAEHKSTKEKFEAYVREHGCSQA